MSAIAWGAAWPVAVEGHHPVVWLVAVPVAKFLAAIALSQSPKTRLAGLGVLLSVPLGALIFFGSCFARLAAG